MQVQNWMSSEVLTVEENDSVIDVIRIFQENPIKHLPVMHSGELVGMITDQDLREASPSRTMTMRAQELHYLLAEMRAKDVMKRNPLTIGPDQTVEVAAVKMLEHDVTGIPVVTEKGQLVGIISQGDVFRVLISITGIYQGGIQFAFNLEDRPGSIKEVAEYVREANGQIVSILSTTDTADEGYRHVFIRVKKLSGEPLQTMIQKLEKNFMLLYVIEDPLKEI